MIAGDLGSCVAQVKHFLETVTGPLIFHISDTNVSQYSFLEALLQCVRPTLLIHTGDLADEYKVGRVPADLPGYRQHANALMKMLYKYVPMVVCVAGNNDRMELMQDKSKMMLLPNGCAADFFGVRILLDHVAVPDAPGMDFALYGHGAREDVHYREPIPQAGAVYLNGNFYWSIIDTTTKRFFRIPCRDLV